MKLLKRLRNLWILSKLPPERILKRVEEIVEEETGEGNAVFMSEMTDAEYAQFVAQHTNGWEPFYDRLNKQLKKDDEAPL